MSFAGTFSDVLNLTFAASGLGLAGLGLTSKLVDSDVGRFVLIKVELLAAAAGHDGILSAAPCVFDESDLREHGFRDIFFVVRATNQSRRATEIARWSIITSKGWEYSLDDFRLNPKLPHRLAPGATADFYVPMEQVFAAVEGAAPLRGAVRGIRAAVRFRSGITRRSRMHKLPVFTGSETEGEYQIPAG